VDGTTLARSGLEAVMPRKLWILLVVGLLPIVDRPARAQEVVGAQRVEINSALFAGGNIFLPKTASSERLRAFIVNLALTANLNQFVGFEGDVGVALGRHTALDLYGVAPSQRSTLTPTVIVYTGSVVVNPIRSDRRYVPFVQAGVGGWRTLNGEEAGNVRLSPSTTYLSGMVGGGLRWFPIRHWGLRLDYRYFVLADTNTAAVADNGPRRTAHQLYAGLIVTF
jgi:hypothetical protein